MTERIEIQRLIEAPASEIFRVLRDPQGHVTIDASGMLQGATGSPVDAVGDTFTVHMDRESLNDYPLGKYDVGIRITAFEEDREIAWTIESAFLDPSIGHIYGYRLEPAPEGEGTLVTSYYDWSQVHENYRGTITFPVVPELALRATLGILDRTVAVQRQG